MNFGNIGFLLGDAPRSRQPILEPLDVAKSKLKLCQPAKLNIIFMYCMACTCNVHMYLTYSHSQNRSLAHSFFYKILIIRSHSTYHCDILRCHFLSIQLDLFFFCMKALVCLFFYLLFYSLVLLAVHY